MVLCILYSTGSLVRLLSGWACGHGCHRPYFGSWNCGALTQMGKSFLLQQCALLSSILDYRLSCQLCNNMERWSRQVSNGQPVACQAAALAANWHFAKGLHRSCFREQSCAQPASICW
ncbi:hypothetical protein COO60DRAFT_1488241 [Scenedesmus sp. NREL 46B-D3]|nr:hypothetical protein COO60DRAFT_1488241 [Scenedesmus sp. NREL 46B-D3]